MMHVIKMMKSEWDMVRSTRGYESGRVRMSWWLRGWFLKNC